MNSTNRSRRKSPSVSTSAPSALGDIARRGYGRAAGLLTTRVAVIVHVAVLITGTAFQAGYIHRLWLFRDDWSFIDAGAGDAFAPHVGHWSTVPRLLFLALRNVWGIDSFLPYAIPIVIAHGLVVHLVWRVGMRSHVAPWIMTALSALLMFHGKGSENILFAFQIGFVGAMVLGLVALMTLDSDRRTPARWVLAVGLLTVALAFAGTAIPFVVAAGFVGWRQGGWRRAAGLVAVPSVVYAAWYLSIGREWPTASGTDGLAHLATGVPEYASNMVLFGVGSWMPWWSLAAAFTGVLLAWALVSGVWKVPAGLLPTTLLVAIVVFALSAGYSRLELGVETALNSRYLYFVVALAAPLTGLGLTALARRWRRLVGPVAGAIFVVAGIQGVGLAAAFDERAAATGETREVFSATLDYLHRYPDHFDVAQRPFGHAAPDMSIASLEWIENEGWFTRGEFRRPVELSALLAMDLSATTEPGPAVGCAPWDGRERPLGVQPFAVDVPESGSLDFVLTDGKTTTPVRTVDVGPGVVRFDERVAFDLHLVGATGDVSICA